MNGRVLDASDRSLRKVLEIAALCNNARPAVTACDRQTVPGPFRKSPHLRIKSRASQVTRRKWH